MKNNKKYTIYMLIFLALLLTPFAGMLLTGPSASESDASAELPALKFEDGKLNKDYLKNMGEYFEGHCSLRQEMVSCYSYVTTKLLKTSSQKSVIYGKDGWMFYTDTLGDYTGSDVMSQRQIFDCARTLKLIDEYCRANDMTFLFVTAANKNSLYGGNMPYYCKKTDKPGNRVLLGAKIRETGVGYVDLYDYFSSEDKILYHKTDSHWTNEGASLASHAIHQAAGTADTDRYGTKAPYKVRKDFQGDLAKMMYPSFAPLEEEYYYDNAPQFAYVGKVESNFDVKIKTTGTGTKNLLMYRDSFGSSLLPFMAEPYANALFSRSLTMQIRDFETMKPDVVIMEKAERFLPQLSENPPMLPGIEKAGKPAGAVELTGAKISMSSANGYTTISGKLAPGSYGDDTVIYVCIGGEKWYEAFPVHTDGGEGFSLYVKETAPDASIKVFGCPANAVK